MGVVADVRNQSLDRDAKKQVYLPLRQSPTAGMALVARTTGDPMTFAGTIQRIIWEVDPGQPIFELSTFETSVSTASTAPQHDVLLVCDRRTAARSAGIYGVLSYSVSQRTKEIDCGWRSVHPAEIPRR